MVDDISHEGLRALLREEGVTFQRLKTWNASKDPRYAEKKARVEQLYAIADRKVTPGTVESQLAVVLRLALCAVVAGARSFHCDHGMGHRCGRADTVHAGGHWGGTVSSCI